MPRALSQTTDVASIYYLGSRFPRSNGRRRQRHRRHHRTHSLPLKITCLAALKSSISSAYRATDGEGGLLWVPGTLRRRRSASDLGVPQPGLGMNNLSGTHSSVPPLRGHPLLKLQQLNVIHNFSFSLFAHCSSAPPRPPRRRRRRACACLVPPLQCSLALSCRPECNRQTEHIPTDRPMTWERRDGPESKEGRNSILPMLPLLIIKYIFVHIFN